TNRTAVLLEARALAAVGLRPAGMAIPLVGVPGDDPQQSQLAIAADQQRWCGLLQRTRVAGGAAGGIVPAINIDGPASPERPDDGDPLLETVEPLLQRRQRNAIGCVLRFVPARADAER